MNTTTENCNIPTSSTSLPSSILLNWIRNILQDETTLNEFENLNFTTEFLSKLFKIDNIVYNDNIKSILDQINSNIPEIFTDFPSTIDFSAYDNGDQNQIIPLLAFIQTEYQVYHINYYILNNPELSFTTYV